MKPTLAFGSLPVLRVKVDGTDNNDNTDMSFSQAGAILLYAGRISGLYPQCPIEAFKVDEALGGIDCLFQQFSRAKSHKYSFKFTNLMRYASGLDKLYAKNNLGPFLLGNNVSIADCKLEMLFRNLEFFDLPKSTLDRYAYLAAASKAVQTKLCQL